MEHVAMNFHYIRYPLSIFLDRVEHSLFKHIELYAAAPHLNIYDCTSADVSFVKKEIEQRKLKLVCLTPEQCVNPVNISIQDTNLRNSSIAYFKRAIEVAEMLDAPRVLVTVGSGYFNRPREEAWERAEEAVSILSHFAESKGITIVLEPLMITTSNVINSSTDLLKMIDAINSPNLVGMLDTSQMSFYNETPNDYFKNLGNKLQYIHFVDRGHLVPGDGDLPLKDYYNQICDNEYKGFSSFEICDRRYYCDPNTSMSLIENWIKSNTY
jgi:fructoselysine 3-epimerase